MQTGTRTTLADFTPVGPGYANGVRVAVRDLDGDGRADVLAGSGTGAGNRVTAYEWDLLSAGLPPLSLDLAVYPGYTGGLQLG